ncbi:DUF397 domain-containing protein [Streptomyces sp. NBC_01497]|uniref:DUF397 domain-containing protein n=1 Tax=Streptomyces sp. NBC_01497 TaxID=2903885 RepID=UPI002E311DB5|nr:DUF397 domain-containing protein [Streptomyces sp. NBC_01497]
MNSGAQELVWFKSTFSGSQGDSCVEIAVTERAVHVRDSKDLTRPNLAVGRRSWGQFLRFTSER